MPQVKDAPVVLLGQVIAVEDVNDFETKRLVGFKVTVLSGDGLAIVKQKTDQRVGEAVAIPGDQVAWFVRQAPWSIDGNSGMSVQFLRPLQLLDVDTIHAAVSAYAAPAPK